MTSEWTPCFAPNPASHWRAEKKGPLGPGRGNYVRGYSYSMVGFAARCLYLNEMLDEANAALAENAQHDHHQG